MKPEEAQQMCEELAAKLHEHFDAVQIMVSWNNEGVTHAAKSGAGNWYARQGMAHEFINADIAQENAQQLSNYINPPEPPEGEEWKA